MIFLIITFSFWKKISEHNNNKMKNYPACKELTYLLERALFDSAAVFDDRANLIEHFVGKQ